MKRLFLFAVLLVTFFSFTSPLPKECEQLIIVRTQSWSSKHGKMQTYKKSANGSKWLPETPVRPVVVGKNGLGWGIGLADYRDESGPVKVEGDGRGPAGIFDLGLIFAKEELTGVSLPFKIVTQNIEAVDDPNSKYYNQIVDRGEVEAVDWERSEKMSAIDLYDVGIEVLHNFPPKDTRAGSAIFVHRWRRDSNSATAGCLAMPLNDVKALALWVKKEKRPLLVQLPEEEFERLQAAWALPPFIGE